MVYSSTLPQKTLIEMLQQHTIVEIKKYLNELSLKIRSGLRKDMMVKVVSKWILDHPDLLMKHLFTYELRMYDKIISHPEDLLLIPTALTRLPFDEITFTDGAKFTNIDGIVSYVASDLADKLKPLLADAIVQREMSGEEDVENHIIGLLNLRGAMPYDDVLDILHSKIKEGNSLDYIIYRINRFAAGNDADDEVVIESPFILGTDFNAFDQRRVDPNTKPKEFSKEEIAKAAIMPYPQIGGAARDVLKKKLMAMGKSEKDTEDFLLDRWLEKQNHTMNPLQGLDTMQYDSFEQVQEFLPYLQDFVNKMPFWKFKGWSSEEIAARGPKLKSGQMPHIVMGPNMRARGITSFEQLQEMAARGEEIPDAPFPPTKRIGRNDPCPCGSGKKYKHCCGR